MSTARVFTAPAGSEPLFAATPDGTPIIGDADGVGPMTEITGAFKPGSFRFTSTDDRWPYW